jgi:hypothetical protein
MLSWRIEQSANLADARARFLGDLRAWVAACRERYAELRPTDVHDQATYTTAWEPYIAATRDEVALDFLLRLRDRLRDHYVATDQWHHGYWRRQEAHHGTEHYELFLGMLLRLAPDDPGTAAQLLDAAEHFGNWVPAIAPWFDWDSGLFHSTHFGTDGVLARPGTALNIPDHLRCANVCLLAHRGSGEQRFLDLATLCAGKWADAIVAGPDLPLALAASGPLYALTADEERHYRSFAGQALADPSLLAERAENFLASDAVNTFLTLWRATGENRFRLAAERLLDALVTQLGDPDAGVVAGAIRDYRRATGDDRYDRAVLTAVAALDPWGWDTLTLDLDARPLALPGGAKRPAGLGKREDMLFWREDGGPRRHSPLLLALAAELTDDRSLATRGLDFARSYFAIARAALPDGRDHGCSSRSVSAIARGNGRENHAGMVTAVLAPLDAHFFVERTLAGIEKGVATT